MAQEHPIFVQQFFFKVKKHSKKAMFEMKTN